MDTRVRDFEKLPLAVHFIEWFIRLEQGRRQYLSDIVVCRKKVRTHATPMPVLYFVGNY